MRRYRATDDLIAVSAYTQETAINTFQTPDISLLLAMSTVFNITPKTEDNKDELTGNEEPDTVYNLGQTAETSFPFEKLQPHQLGFLLAYGLGAISTATAGSTGYLHTFTPIDGDVDVRRSNPSFSTMMKYSDVFKAKFSSCFVDNITLTFSKDAWVKTSSNIKATGKVTENYTQESISALDNVTELTLDANAIHGATAQERLDNVHQIIAETSSGVWEEVTYTAVSDATPAVITIADVGGAGTETITYKVLYIPDESTNWTFPSRITSESPLRTTQTRLNVGGTWDGTDFSGGKTVRCEVKNLEWSFNNNLQIENCFGESGNYAGRAWRDGRTQTLKLDRELRDVIMKQRFLNNDQFGLYVKAEGAEYESGHNYTIEVIFPKLQILKPNVSVDGKKLSESVEIAVLQDATYGSVIARVKNKVATYAA